MDHIRSVVALALLYLSLMLHKVILTYTFIMTQFLLVSSSEVAVFDRENLPVPPRTEAEIFLDSEQRISENFQIPPALIPRVAFWFDVYSKYGSHQQIIHHIDYPWWIIEVIDTADILSGPANAQWLNVEKAKKMTKAKIAATRISFQRLAQKVRKSKELTDSEQVMLKKIDLLPGGIQANLNQVAKRLRLQTGQKDFYLEGLRKSTRYLTYMEKIFTDRGLPKELTRLPLVESSFNEDAGSKVGALGIWQLMPAVSKKFISVTDEIDERKSPFKATTVAAKMFQENFRLLSGCWPLVVTAYNHGPGSLRKAVKDLGTDDIGVIITKYRGGSFGFASENFYSEFLAALIVEQYSKEVLGDLADLNLKLESASVEPLNLPRNAKIGQILALSQLSAEEFISYNPDLKKALRLNRVLPKGFTLFLPSLQLTLVQEGLERQLRVAQK